jgi:hypothetical protein
MSNSNEPSNLNPKSVPPLDEHIRSPDFTRTCTEFEANFIDMRCLTVSFKVYNAPVFKRWEGNLNSRGFTETDCSSGEERMAVFSTKDQLYCKDERLLPPPQIVTYASPETNSDMFLKTEIIF